MEEFYNYENEDSKLNKNNSSSVIMMVVAFIIIIISTVITVIASVVGLGGIYNMQNSIGNSAMFILIPIIFIIIITSIVIAGSGNKKGKYLLATSFILLILSFVGLSYQVGNALKEREAELAREKLAYEKIISLFKNMLPEEEFLREEIDSSKYGKMAPLVLRIQELALDAKTVQKENARIIETINNESFFSLDTLSDLNKIKEKRQVINKAIEDLQKVKKDGNELFDEYKEYLIDNKTGLFKNIDIQQLEDSVTQGNEILTKGINNIENIAKSEDKILGYLEENQGAYTFEDGQLVFYEDDDVYAYNEIIDQYEKAIDENNKHFENTKKNFENKIEEYDNKYK